MTLTFQIDAGCRRLLHISLGRSVRSALSFFVMLKKAEIDYQSSIRFVCSDMWRAYLKVIKKKLPGAMHILDRYHIVANLGKALDQVRADEARQLAAKNPGWGILKHTRWLLLSRRKRLDGKQRFALGQLLRWNLRTVRADILVDGFQALWEYSSPTCAGRFLDAWCRHAMRSRLDPIKKVAKSLRNHREEILNWFWAKKQYNSGIVESLNLQAKLRFRKACGFRTTHAIEVALYHQLGQLPQPKLTHKFC